MKAAVLGAGSWGTTFAQVLCDAGTRTVLYSRKPRLARTIADQHENPDYLPGITLSPSLEACSDVGEALDGADLVAFAVPAQTLRANLDRVGAAAAAAGAARQPHEGDRVRHQQADERGHRRGDRRSGRADRRGGRA
jgi:glycerol-3-phosphate dehydrogenase